MKAVGALVTSGAQAVKLEGVDGHEDVIRHIVGSGVPVMGHIGLTPQSVNQFGGFRVQGKTEADAARLVRQAHALEDLGCFSIVLECVPAELAARITSELAVPTIGIGAGVGTDGQILVLHDLWGLDTSHVPALRPALPRWRARPDRRPERVRRRREGVAVSRARRRATRDARSSRACRRGARASATRLAQE